MAANRQKPIAHYIHRTSYSFQEQLVGLFVLAAAVILLALLFSMLRQQNIFEDYFVIYGRLNSAAGLSQETTVQISGIEVGSVSNIEITRKNDILLTLSIAQKYHRLIRSDSLVKVSSLNATVFGRSVIEITAGSPDKPMVPEGAELQLQESVSIDTVIEEATATLKTVRDMINNLSSVIAAVNPDEIRQVIASIDHMSTNLSNMSDHMAAGKGGLGSLIYDKKLERTFEKSIDNLQQATARLDVMMATLKNDAAKVPEVIEEVQGVIDETRKTIEATQRIWPISSALPKPETKPLIVDPLPAND
jgi:phospholipid/cholesterol/gamma-HCH transport system substrate-binding protein